MCKNAVNVGWFDKMTSNAQFLYEPNEQVCIAYPHIAGK